MMQSGPARVSAHHVGRSAIEAFFGGVSAQITFAAHLAMNSIVDVENDKATGSWRILMPCTMVEAGKKISRWMVGDYVEEYVRRNGTWLFSKIDYVKQLQCALRSVLGRIRRRATELGPNAASRRKRRGNFPG